MDALASFDIEAVEGKIEREGQETKERAKKKKMQQCREEKYTYIYIHMCVYVLATSCCRKCRSAQLESITS